MSKIKLSNTAAGMSLIAARYPMVYDAFYKTPGLLVSVAAFLGLVCGVFHIGATIGEAIWGDWSTAVGAIKIAAVLVLAVLGNVVLIQMLNVLLITAVRIRAAMWSRASGFSMDHLSTEDGMAEADKLLVKQTVTYSINRAGKKLGKKGIAIQSKGDMQIIDHRHESENLRLSDQNGDQQRS